MVEVLVSGMQRQVVLQDDGRDPHIVRRNWCPLTLKLSIDGGVVVGGLVVRKSDVHTVLEEQLTQRALVLCLSATYREPGTKLGEHYERDYKVLRSFEEVDRFSNAAA